MSSQLTAQELASLKRADLQKLCKDHNIKANLRTDQLVELLSKLGETSSLPGDQETAHTRPPSAANRMPSSLAHRPKLRKSLSQPTLASTAGHSRSNSKDSATMSIKQSTSARAVATKSSAATVRAVSGSGKVVLAPGKENGSTSRAGKTSSVPVTAPPVSTSVPVARGIAGRIAVFGRAIGSGPAGKTSAGPAPSVASRKVTASRPPPTKPAITAMTFVEPDPPTFVPIPDPRIQTLEFNQAELVSQLASIQKSSSSRDGVVDSLRADIKGLDHRLVCKDGEIQRLQGELEDSRTMAEGHAAANEELRYLVSQLSIRLASMEDALKKSNEDSAAREDARVGTLEAALQQLSRTVEAQSKAVTAPSPSPYGLPVSFTMMENRGSPASDYRYLDLELTSTPSGNRRRGHVPRVGNGDLLLQYNGFGRTSVDGSEGPRYF